MTKSAKPRKRSATAGRKSKPWRTRARLDLLPLEVAISKMVVQRTPPELIARWVRSQPTFGEVTDEQVAGCVEAIKARWAATRDDPDLVAKERAAHAAMLDAAIHDAWNVPVMIFKQGEGWVPLLNPDGTACTKPDHKALAAYMKERRELFGLTAPTTNINLNLNAKMPSPASLSPADREAEVQALLARRREALKVAGRQDVIDVEAAPVHGAGAQPALPAPKKSTRRRADGVDR